MVDGPVRPLPQDVVLPRGPASVPARGHGTGAGPAVEEMGLPHGLPPTPAAGPSRAPACRSVCQGTDGPPPSAAGGASGPGPGRGPHDRTQASGHPAPRQQAGEEVSPFLTGPPTPSRASSPPQPVRPAATHTPANTTVGPAGGAPDSGARRGLRPAVGPAYPGVAPVVRTPRAGPGGDVPDTDTSALPPPAEATPSDAAGRASPRGTP